jgi:iron complex outermembrane receptor protein
LTRRYKFDLWAGTAIIAFIGATPLLAQNAPAPQSASKDQVEDIVITARRVEERAQNTPISVTAISGDRLKALNVTRVEGLASLAPNLVIGDAPANGIGTIVFIRGIGQLSVSSYSDPPINIYVDGVAYARPVGNAFDLPDLDRVEVLRGPQGTLFGRNTTGGAITLYTKAPSQEFGGAIDVGYGKYNEIETSLLLNTGEIGDSGILSKFTFQRRTADGWVRTPGVGDSNAAGYSRSASGSFTLAKQFSSVSVTNRLYFDRTEASPAYQVVTATPAAAAYFSQSAARGGPPFLISPGPLDVFYEDPRRQYQPVATAWGDTLNIAYDINPGLTLKSISGYRNLNQHQSGQIGGSDVVGPVINPNTPGVPIQSIDLVTPFDAVHQQQESQEFQLNGKSGEFSYVAGLYYFHEKVTEGLEIQVPVVLSPASALNVTEIENYTISSTSYAAYGNVSYRPKAFSDKLEISAGIRYTKDHKSEVASELTNGSLAGPQRLSDSWSNVGWSASVNYQWTQDFMTYVRGSSGYRAGGFNPSQIGAPAFNPEDAKTIEAGAKTEFFDRRVLLNGAVFKTYYDNLQISQENVSTATFFVANAGQATYTGFELEGAALLGHGFRLNGSVGYVDPKYQKYLFQTGTGGTINLASQAKFPFVSKLTYNVGGEFTSELTPVGKFKATVNYAYQSSHTFASLYSVSPNAATNPSGPSKNLTASLVVSDLPIKTGAFKNLRLEIHGDNLLNNRFRLSFIDLTSYGTASFNRPVSYGVRLLADF